MAARKIHEMIFSDFAQAIVPDWVISLTNPVSPSLNQAEWLTSSWNSADRRLTHSIYWRDGSLTSELPFESLKYHFNDFELRPIAQILGLDPTSDADHRKVAELLSSRNAWLNAIQCYCHQPSAAGQRRILDYDVADDFVRLTCNWLQHPWVQESVQQHIIGKSAQTGCTIDLSSDPTWPNPQVNQAHFVPLSRSEQAKLEAEKNDINYWLTKFESDDRSWSSEFEVYAWDAQSDINIASRKIKGLQEHIEKQQSLIQGFERVLRRNKRRAAELCNADKPGRPRKSPERQEVARRFTAHWVQSWMEGLNVNNSVQLGELVSDSSERNWRRWQTGQSVPTIKSLLALQTAKITQGYFKGQPFLAIETDPTFDEMLMLIRLTGVASKMREVG